VKFFIDECISPSLSQHLNQDGLHDAIHPRDRRRLRDPDHIVFAHAIAEDRIIVTENANDFRKLAGSVDLHPGLIILPSVARAEAQRLMDVVIAHLIDVGGECPQDLLVNSVLTITLAAEIRIDPLP
jgi:predicted nuclease of predicted toxin-antitoxin system